MPFCIFSPSVQDMARGSEVLVERMLLERRRCRVLRSDAVLRSKNDSATGEKALQLIATPVQIYHVLLCRGPVPLTVWLCQLYKYCANADARRAVCTLYDFSTSREGPLSVTPNLQ